jgi:hypothetical protein
MVLGPLWLFVAVNLGLILFIIRDERRMPDVALRPTWELFLAI